MAKTAKHPSYHGIPKIVREFVTWKLFPLPPHPHSPNRRRVRVPSRSTSGLRLLRKLPAPVAVPRLVPDIPNPAYRLLPFRREASSALAFVGRPATRHQKVSYHHRRLRNRRRSRGTNWPPNSKNQTQAD